MNEAVHKRRLVLARWSIKENSRWTFQATAKDRLDDEEDCVRKISQESNRHLSPMAFLD
jgi:hypothetical protein